ncbi:O-antigen ligase family protein [Rubrobacter xylanophilus]|uniref:O-antigen ligase family protein n=1 Tax=Rubrobacter xylanophilus TaxID=49319 RepID=UPI00117B1721|nr:O-antigen ligase family protein [Rubrobacter xylanophilus]
MSEKTHRSSRVPERWSRWERSKEQKDRRPGRLLAAFKALVLLVIVVVTGYGMLDVNLVGDERMLPFAAGLLALLFVTLFVRGFYADVPTVGWVLVGFMGALVGIKGFSMLWTLSESETIKETLRSSMYLAVFLMALAALSSWRQVWPLVDMVCLIVGGVAGYGLLQKLEPLQYPVASLDGVRVDSTLGYSNTAAVVLAMGVVLALARMARMRGVFFRGVYAVLLLAFLAALYLTVSRGGIGSLALGLVMLLALANNRLQTLANLMLALLPGVWLWWSTRGLEGLLQQGATDEQRVAAGEVFGEHLAVALVAAFVLQVGYAFLVNRYELLPPGRRLLGGAFAAAGVAAVVAAGILVVSQYGGMVRAYQELVSNPNQTQNVAQRLASLSIGFREDYWRVAWEEWMEHPLTGSGAGTFTYTWFRERPVSTGVRQVHNLYLEQGTETGVFAFAALVGFVVLLLGYTARAAWRSGTRNERRMLLSGLTCALAVYLISSVFEWHWYIPPSTLLFFFLAGVAVKVASRADWPEPEEGGGSGRD